MSDPSRGCTEDERLLTVSASSSFAGSSAWIKSAIFARMMLWMSNLKEVSKKGLGGFPFLWQYYAVFNFH
jgi:hypothetical protein